MINKHIVMLVAGIGLMVSAISSTNAASKYKYAYKCRSGEVYEFNSTSAEFAGVEWRYVGTRPTKYMGVSAAEWDFVSNSGAVMTARTLLTGNDDAYYLEAFGKNYVCDKPIK